MNPIETILEKYPAVILDGALATELERRGADLKDKLWSAKLLIENPEMIRQLHMDYFLAGADCAITASYQATVEGFMRRGLSENEAIALIQKSVKIAIEARDDFWKNGSNRIGRPRPFVAASVGPYGAYLADGSEYRGEYGLSQSELEKFHRPRIEALIAAGADILACETIPCLIEAQAIVNVLKEFPNASAWISFSAKDNVHISGGEKISDCAARLDQFPQVAALGVNCTSPKFISSLIRAVKSKTSKPILVYPNSGETYNAEKHDWNGDAFCTAFGEEARHWFADGAQIIGGCCRTTPDDIRAIAGWART
ncbi:MAG: homocysteine S-methyltransferase [Chloroflexi bacterium]|nr:homocysteine S-methyltransferase [Chloroflexota bacterium]MBI3338971.1 homocysteine S-methyltransferase [Chloroflexota bacterium]